MSAFEGTLQKVDLGVGAWVLQGRGGRWLLVGRVPAALEGRRVRVTGELIRGMGNAMTGDPTVEVGSIVAIPD